MALSIDYVPATGEANVDGLLVGTAWHLGDGRLLTYSFATADGPWEGYAVGSEPDAGFVPPDAAARAAVRWALDQWAAVADIEFVEVDEANGTAGTLRIGFTAKEPSRGILGYTYPPQDTARGGDVWLNAHLLDEVFTDYVPGSLAAFSVLHELGHALGLKHPHAPTAYNAAVIDAADDCLANSAMSYFAWPEVVLTKTNTDRLPMTPMAFDIDALQALYGPNTSSHAGDDNYAFDSTGRYLATLYDTGGTDTLSVSGSRDAYIDLRPGAWSRIGLPFAVSDGGIESPETLLIHESSLIENARSDAGNDVLVGNDLDNLLRGGAGRDTLTGGAGNDSFELSHFARGAADRITDFSAGDSLVFDTGEFAVLAGSSAENFVRGHAREADDHLIYRARLHALYYDADGSGADFRPVKIVALHGPAARHLEFDDLGFI